MSNVRVISFARRDYERILSFLYPTYAVLSAPSLASEFIVRMDVKQKSDRDLLDYQYSDCVIISKHIFDELWTEVEIIREVLDFARRNLGCRRRSFKPLNTEGSAFIDECISFMFTGVGGIEDESETLALFDAYGSTTFIPMYVRLCQEQGVGMVNSSMETFVLKLLRGSEGRFYQRATMRLRGALQPNLLTLQESVGYMDSFFVRHYRDLHTLWRWLNLCKRNYF